MTEPQIINLRAELRALPGVTHRTPEMHGDALADAFGPTHAYRDGFISTVKFSGESAWEKHPGDEVLIVADGTGYLLVHAGAYVVPRSLNTGTVVIVPAGAWHKIESADGISLMTVTPQPTVHVHNGGAPPQESQPCRRSDPRPAR